FLAHREIVSGIESHIEGAARQTVEQLDLAADRARHRIEIDPRTVTALSLAGRRHGCLAISRNASRIAQDILYESCLRVSAVKAAALGWKKELAAGLGNVGAKAK